MAREHEVTSTYVNVDVKVMKQFKKVIGKEGYRLRKGFENALIEYTDKRIEKEKGGSVSQKHVGCINKGEVSCFEAQDTPVKTEPCHDCKKPRELVEFGAFICPCPHCGDECPF